MLSVVDAVVMLSDLLSALVIGLADGILSGNSSSTFDVTLALVTQTMKKKPRNRQSLTQIDIKFSERILVWEFFDT